MHALLALSALHLGHTNPEQRNTLVRASMRHQNTALKQFASNLEDLNSENCHISVLFAAFTFITGMFTMGREGEEILLSDVAQCFLLVQGRASIRDGTRACANPSGVGNMLSNPSVWATVSASPIGPLIAWPQRNYHPASSFAERLDELAALVPTMQVSEPMCLVDEIGVRSQCLAAVNRLQGTYSMMLASERKVARIWSWPIMISRDFIELVRKGEPVALVILAHYAAMVTCYEEYYWYLDGWGEKVCRVVEDALTEERWVRWIEWPIKCVRDSVDVRGL